MKSLVRGMAALAAVAVLVSTSAGQDQGKSKRQRGGFGMFGGAMGVRMDLLTNADVQKELKLTEDEKAFVTLLKQQSDESGREFFEKLRDLPQEERAAKFQQRAKEQEKQVAEILGNRMDRFKQIQLQLTGLAMAINMPDYQQKLKITDSQKEKLEEMRQSAREEMGKFFGPNAEGDEESRAKAFAEFRKKQNEAAQNLLTDEQKKSWQEMTGTPITFDVPMPRFGRFGGGGRPPRDGQRKGSPPN